MGAGEVFGHFRDGRMWWGRGAWGKFSVPNAVDGGILGAVFYVKFYNINSWDLVHKSYDCYKKNTKNQNRRHKNQGQKTSLAGA